MHGAGIILASTARLHPEELAWLAALAIDLPWGLLN